uniref:Uncharacterized protein n=1 Tax=Tetranychus urticae TaxID=32264 RepID=T1L105_TETUR
MVDGLAKEGFVRQKNILEFYKTGRNLPRIEIWGIMELRVHQSSRINPDDLNPLIAYIITIGAPWGGSMNALRA